jgi:non-specific serine/threonine protein kinase/serine/threonine-protein kinase
MVMHSTDPNANEATEFVGARPVTDTSSALEPGMQLGAYVIRDVLGEGGMGRVYLAEQMRPVHREVALKLIREQVASPLARAYFDVERQALAQMQHPAIAQVFDAGTTEQGHPYLAMELVEGRPITRFCRDEKLSEDERLALFARVCHGVQHAHQKGIIHRDLKPANVLVQRVDGTPMPKIIDFGIAIGGIASDTNGGVAAEATMSDQAGTSMYMSPEQATQPARGLDTRSDVYSLGVMLYEVLTDRDAVSLMTDTGRLRQSGHRTLLATLDSHPDRRAAPAPDSLLHSARQLPRELRAIMRKALAIDRADRYDSAVALADDLERFRQNRPVKAMPQTRAYLLRTFVARHRLGLVVAGLIAASLVVGIALALDGLARARRSAAIAESEAAKAAQVADFVRGMLAGIDPDRARGMDNRLMHTILDSAAERAGRELATQPDVRAEIERTIAGSYASLGEFALADTHYESALAAAHAANLPPAKIGEFTSQRALGLNGGGHPQEALASANESLKLAAALPADDRQRLLIESRLAAIERDAGKIDPARARFQRVLAAQTKTLGDMHPDTLESQQGLAITDFVGGRYDEARPLLQDLVAKYRKQRGAEDVKTVGAMVTQAVLENEQEHYADAVKLLTPLLPLVEKVYGPDHPRTLVVVMNLGSATRYEKHYDEARPYYLRALELARKLYGPTAPRTLMAEGNLSLMLRDAGDLTEAERHARFAADNAEKSFGDNPYRAGMYRGLATVLTRQGRYAEAERELDRSWAVFTAAEGYGPNHPRSQEVVDSYIELYQAWKKPDREAAWQAKKTLPPSKE